MDSEIDVSSIDKTDQSNQMDVDEQIKQEEEIEVY